jgi:uncharacterized protein
LNCGGTLTFQIIKINRDKHMFSQLFLLLLSLVFSIAQKTTPLHKASKNPNHAAFMEVLNSLNSDYNVNAVDEDGNTALMWSSWQGHDLNVASLIKAGATIDLQESDGNTALLKASWNGKDKVVQLLLNAGADVNKMNYYKITSLMMASQQGQANVVKILINNGANVNDKDQGGVTALHKACWMGRVDVVKILIDAGANVNAARYDGITPSALAESSVVEGRTQETAQAILKLLEDAGAVPPKKEKIDL